MLLLTLQLVSVPLCPCPSVGQARPREEYPGGVPGDRAGRLDEMVLTWGLLTVKPKPESSFWRVGLKTITLIQPGRFQS